MNRVIIVDDEPWAIKGIRNAFNWTKYGFEITGQFTSVHKAFDFICEDRPDLVFTDIRMPEISGLDLMKKTKDMGLDVEFVVVSGFAEFAYAQEALRYGALDYCLKPLDIEMADPLIEKLALHFSTKRGIKNNQILEALTSSDKSELNRLTQLFDHSTDYYFRVIIMYSNGEKKHDHDISAFNFKPTLTVDLGSRKTLYILKSENRMDLDVRFDSAVFSDLDIKAVGISSISNQYDHMTKLIKEADIAASTVFINEANGIFEYEQKLNLAKPYIDGICSIIQEKKFEEMNDIMDRLMVFFHQHHLGMGEVVYLWNQLVSSLVGSYYEELQYMELDFLNYSELKERFETFESLCSFLTDIMTYVKQLNHQSANEGDKNFYFAQMVKYIDTHFQSELYLKDLSAKFLINQVYCCQLFKKNLGKTFSEYVTDLRIKKACELLKHTELSIDEIAAKVGYMDYYYFNKVFKKQSGITPTKFRKS
ncbi:response regulator transcription factor [Paenibacillus sp. Soil750]|uniref:response regulator transcription factor n=1 Tax=Paenibacillus sp. Soil750 TaxID=1736398 RepID=UPI0006FA14D5|nr:response regulator [Paenibacillus sp. Soil750]KRE64806.1 AraC family transcriptional regulator [Paenibacillus sp. Soil750]